MFKCLKYWYNEPYSSALLLHRWLVHWGRLQRDVPRPAEASPLPRGFSGLPGNSWSERPSPWSFGWCLGNGGTSGERLWRWDAHIKTVPNIWPAPSPSAFLFSFKSRFCFKVNPLTELLIIFLVFLLISSSVFLFTVGFFSVPISSAVHKHLCALTNHLTSFVCLLFLFGWQKLHWWKLTCKVYLCMRDTFEREWCVWRRAKNP